MPKTFSQEFTKAISEYIQNVPRSSNRWVPQSIEIQKNQMYHKWTREEEIILCNLIASYSTNWELINKQFLQQFNILQLKNKYREIVSGFNLQNGKKPKKQERINNNNGSSSSEVTTQNEEYVYKVLRDLLSI